MPLFEVDARRSTLVQPLAPSDTGFVEQAAPVVDDHVARLLGEQIFPVLERGPGVRHEDAPHLLALDASGQPVVLEMVSKLDAASLTLALAHAGRAGRLTRADVAERFPEGVRQFERAFAAFRDGAPIARTRGQREGARLLLLCAQVDPSVTDALDFLRLTNQAVTVLRLGVVTGPDGRRLVEVEPLYGAAKRPRTTSSAPAAQPGGSDAPADEQPVEPRPEPETPASRPAASTTPAPPTRTTTRSARLPTPPGDLARAALAAGLTGTPPGHGSRSTDPGATTVRAAHSSVPVPAPADALAAAASPAASATSTPPAAPPRRAALPSRGTAAPPVPRASPASPVPPIVPATATPAPVAAPSSAFMPRSDAAGTPLPSRRSRAERREATYGSHPTEHQTDGLDRTTVLGSSARPPAPEASASAPPVRSSALPPVTPATRRPVPPPGAPLDDETRISPLSAPLPVPDRDTPLHGVSSDDDPDLFMLAQSLGRPTSLVWARPRRGQFFEAVLHPTGQIELPGRGRYRNPDAAAAAAVGQAREDGWDVWRIGAGGPSLTEAFREQFA